MVDNSSYILDLAQALVIIHRPHISTTSLSKGWGFKGAYKAYLFCSQYLASLGLVLTERGMSALYISILGL